jgi:hypothetical protein
VLTWHALRCKAAQHSPVRAAKMIAPALAIKNYQGKYIAVPPLADHSIPLPDLLFQSSTSVFFGSISHVRLPLNIDKRRIGCYSQCGKRILIRM